MTTGKVALGEHDFFPIARKFDQLDYPNNGRNIILFDAYFEKLLNFNILIMFQ